jgi:hypothetical protein
MKERLKVIKEWKNVSGDIEVWIEEKFGIDEIVFYNKNSNKAQHISIEEAEAIHNAFAYFKNEKII